MRALTVACALLGLAPLDAYAHGRSTSTSVWEVTREPAPGARVVVRVGWNDVQRAVPGAHASSADALTARADLSAAVDSYLTERFTLLAGGARCEPSGPVRVVPSLDPTHVARAWRVTCRSSGPLAVRVDGFFDFRPGHFHLARISIDGGPALESIFVADRRQVALAPNPAATQAPRSGFGDYLALGVEHIATGVDHLVFLLALLLMGVSAREVVTIVTGFTVAHSVTLALGVLGVVEPLPRAVEALIGLSIVVVALENFALTAGASLRRWILRLLGVGVAAAALGSAAGFVAVPATALVGVGCFSLAYLGLVRRSARPGALRWFIAFVFGLLHGFGFAGMLTQIGLPAGRMAAALFGFNVGVELGQLVVVAAVWPLLRLGFSRHPGPKKTPR